MGMPAAFSGSRTKTKVKCPQCRQLEMARIARQGFLRERIYPLLGLYPWQCAICGKEAMLRRRGAVIRKPQHVTEEPGESAAATVHQH
jgi:ribosomal protein L37AE/L43A